MNNNFHLFKTEYNNIVYLPDYKQAYCITDDDFFYIRNNNSVDTILEKYTLNNKAKKNKENIAVEAYQTYELYLCISNMCNSRCIYCFAHYGDYGKEKGIMDFQTGKKAVDFFVNKIVSENSKCIITFFGGEPLMAYDVIKLICEYIKLEYKDKNIEFHITTNATLLTHEIIDFLTDNQFKIALSIDGGINVQNTQRPLINGGDSYYEATKNIDYLLNKTKNVLIRGTYYNLDYDLYKCYEELVELNAKEVNIVPDISDLRSDEDIRKLVVQLENVKSYVLEYAKSHDDFPFGIFKTKIRELFLPKKESIYRCGAGKNTVSIDLKGNIYACHRLSEFSDFNMGNVYSTNKIKDINFKCNSCNSCWNKYTCTHGCVYEDIVQKNRATMMEPAFCAYSKKMTEMAIEICMNLPKRKLINILGINNLVGK